MANQLNWFEIPTKDIERAAQFYRSVMGYKVDIFDFGGLTMGFFAQDNPGDLNGSLVQHEDYVPSDKMGVLIYLNGGKDLQPFLDRVEGAGGKILQAKKQISEEYGYMAIFLDSEGNRMAIHSEG